MATCIRTPSTLTSFREELRSKLAPKQTRVAVCAGTGCRANRGLEVAAALRRVAEAKGILDQVDIRVTGCLGFCEKGPIVHIQPKGLFYTLVTADDAADIVEQTLIHGEEVERLFAKDPETGQLWRTKDDIPFFKYQKPVLFGANFEMGPESIEDYIRLGGYGAAARALTQMRPDEIIDEITRSGLRGRGGAGFPTGVKWSSCREAKGEKKYVICNADEGDPGAYANRSLLEGNPHSVLEGMLIGAYAIGASEGFIYVRTEYPLAVDLIRTAIESARGMGLLGRNILGSGLDFDITLNRGGGAFVCGESTALMASIEGQAGEPRAKHIHTVERGLWDAPSTLNNVETWANVPLIINRGADWYARIGTGDVTENPWGGSKGTKIFSLVGKVNHTGLVEVPMGITLRQVIYDIGGGIPNGKKFKGVQTGGPSGGVLAEQHLDLPIDYDQLVEVGSMMGSGGMIVMDEDNCMVDFARFFLAFLENESCGKCTPCREGITQMRRLLEDIGSGRASMETLDRLHDLAEVVRDASLCMLGATAPNPVLTTLEYFRNEYEIHIRDRKCPAGVCKGLVRYRIDPEKCTGCTLCAKNCPTGAVRGKKKQAHYIDAEHCTKCGLCYDSCKFDAVIRD